MLSVLCLRPVCGVISMDMLTPLTLFAVGTYIRRLIQFWTALRYISITDLKAVMIWATLASVEIATMDRGIFTYGVPKTGELIDTVILAFRSEAISESSMITYFSGDRRS